jgi:hypothetical protein
MVAKELKVTNAPLILKMEAVFLLWINNKKGHPEDVLRGDKTFFPPNLS